jgi:hypothetical protein
MVAGRKVVCHHRLHHGFDVCGVRSSRAVINSAFIHVAVRCVTGLCSREIGSGRHSVPAYLKDIQGSAHVALG